MSTQKSNKQESVEEVVETVVSTVETTENLDPKITDDSSTDEAVEAEWISPTAVNYKELEEILAGEELSDYVGDRLPEEEVKRINTDYQLYLKNK